MTVPLPRNGIADDGRACGFGFERESVMTKNDGGPAFPAKRAVEQMLCTGYDEHESPTFEPTMVIADYPGMSLRDWFAGQALAGLCADPSNHDLFKTQGEAVENAYSIADAMIAARDAK